MGKSQNKADRQAMSIERRKGFTGQYKEAEAIKVKCYSGHTYAERPDSFAWQDKEYKVQNIEKEWQEPGERHFRVQTEDGKFFELCYNEQEDEWSLIEFS